jgi:hypothetical protein
MLDSSAREFWTSAVWYAYENVRIDLVNALDPGLNASDAELYLRGRILRSFVMSDGTVADAEKELRFYEST